MLDKRIILVGYSGHGSVVAEAALSSGLKLNYYAEKKALKHNPFKLKYIGYERDETFVGWKHENFFILGIGNNKLRLETFNLIKSNGCETLNVIHETAAISKHIKLGSGNFIARNSSINPLVIIEDCCIINTGAIIEHECIIKTGVHIAPGAVLAGNVIVNNNSFIGANSVIKEGVKIGKNVIVGAGSVVVKDVEDGKKVVGNPLRELKL